MQVILNIFLKTLLATSFFSKKFKFSYVVTKLQTVACFRSYSILLKKWLKPAMLDKERYDLRSNQTI